LGHEFKPDRPLKDCHAFSERLIVIPAEEIQLKVEDLQQALDYERRHRYSDVQGRKKAFSSYMGETLKFLKAYVASDRLPPGEFDVLIDRFYQYRNMDIGGRMATMEQTERFIQSLIKARLSPAESLRRTSSSSSAQDLPQGKSVHELEVQFLKGVGPKYAQLLNQVGVFTVEHLLYYFPRRYLDYQNRVKIQDLKEGQDVTVMGSIQSVTAYQAKGKNIAIVTVTIGDETGLMSASWFYAKSSKAALESYKSRFSKGMDVMLSGKVKWDKFKRRPAIDRPQLEILSYQDHHIEDEPVSLHAGRIVPVYPMVEGLNLRFLRKAIHQGLESYLNTLIDPLPEPVLKKYGLIALHPALQQIHFPETQQHHQDARRRLVFDELFYIQARLCLMRNQYKRTVKGLSLMCHDGGLVDQFIQTLPFQLTGAQKRVFGEICQDLSSPEPMYRMIQGDVGSGKTILALLALLVAVENGYQGALMAPTEILSEQHYRRFVQWLTPLGIRVGLFVGKSGQKERRELRQSLLNGQIHLAVGTHALIQEDVEFHKLGVVVVDEQHRFGVRQRTLLKEKGDHPEMLTMTATPIPRSLAMTLHGDLDVSVVDELPPGRSPIKTTLLKSSQQNQAYQLIKMEVLKGRQAYVVFPLIEESETLSAKAATQEAERLQHEVFPELTVGLLHGKMSSDEKDTVMSAFAKGDIQVLVSTTVVEVGVDVPNATVMVIESADRFGLAQLHQLRGRVGRGVHQSYCALVCDSRNEETMKRLNILVSSEDGFYISEKDMELRGPGEFLGTRQSGMPDLVLADLIQDKSILEMARACAQEWIDNPDGLSAYPELQEMIFQKTDQSFSVLGSG
jgi:ATP-dependent DNA helicase RecG